MHQVSCSHCQQRLDALMGYARLLDDAYARTAAKDEVMALLVECIHVTADIIRVRNAQIDQLSNQNQALLLQVARLKADIDPLPDSLVA
jgi:hypothetical protein